VRVFVTGADGFAGRWLVRALLAAGEDLTCAVRPGSAGKALFSEHETRAISWVPMELSDTDSVRKAVPERCDAVMHLGALSSGADSLADPGAAWSVNAAGTARLLDELGRRKTAGYQDPVVLVVSTGEVYGVASRPAAEADPPRPVSPYAASKAGAELAAFETWRRTGLRVIVARAFAHTGPGQDERFVAAAFARRLKVAFRARAPVVKVGNLEPVRDISDVRDVIAAYLALLGRGVPGEAYNVCSGTGISLRTLFDRLAEIVGVAAIPEPDPELVRPSDLPYLVGDNSKLRAATGWMPAIPLDTTLRELVNAQAD
jgi:GDP-4-dehydro-6-deoxy-D-mannose reductase